MKAFRCFSALYLLLCLFIAGCERETSVQDITFTRQDTTVQEESEPQAEEIRAVWISCFDLPSKEKMRSEESFRAMADEMLRNIRNAGFNTAFLHVRPYSDAFYRSSFFPYSAYISPEEGVDPGYDALQIFCERANAHGVSLHAWINLFRIGSASKFDARADSNPAKKILCDDDPQNDFRVVRVDGTLYYDPASDENQTLILDGVREILQNYPVSGIHIDDYFYPTAEPFVDQAEYEAYLAAGGSSARSDWRRAQISALVRRLYTCVKSFGEEKVFSISPSIDSEKNRNTLFADVTRWAAYDGYCDWLIPQIYVGFSHDTKPFCKMAAQWRSMERCESVRLLFGLAAYKCGKTDNYAGSAKNEWIENSDILSRQIVWLRESGECSGFSLFSYSYIFGEKMSDNSISEMKSVISVL